MSDTLAFSTFDASSVSAPKVCPLCKAHPAVFEYKLRILETQEQESEGFCCLSCAGNLLQALAKIQCTMNQQRDHDSSETGAN